MLKGLDPLLNAELLHALASMGHGDEIAIVDANFPAASLAKRLIRLDGADATAALRAILTVLPLDHFVKAPVLTMQVVGKPKAMPPVVAEFAKLAKGAKLMGLERNMFYKRAHAAFAVVATSERRLYGNCILVKGAIGPDGRDARP